MAAGASLSRRLSGMPPYSYRDDPQVPRFPDDKGLIVFDGVCVLCTRLGAVRAETRRRLSRSA